MARRVAVSPGAFFLAALLVLMLPLRWWAGAFLAAAVHEFSHLAMICLTGGDVTGITVGPLGACMEAKPMSRTREALCAAAGPLGSFFFTVASSLYPEAAVCAAVQGAFNLLPIDPLDGGRILRLLVPETICAAVEVFVLIMLLGMGLWLNTVLNLGIYPLIPGLAAAVRVIQRKFPCKEGKLAVQ